jgi:uncharacterized membrane protein YczE
MKKQLLCRGIFYVAGEILVALSVSLNAKCGLGGGTSTCIVFALSQAFAWNISTVLIVVNSIMVLIQILMLGKGRISKTLLQLPFNLAFAGLVELYNRFLPISFALFWQNLLVACASVVAMGTGVWLMVNMDLVPNPPDGLTRAFSEIRHISLGTSKNIADAIFLGTAVLVGLGFEGKILGIGIGTVIAVIFGGRVIALLDALWKEKLLRAAGMQHASCRHS